MTTQEMANEAALAVVGTLHNSSTQQADNTIQNERRGRREHVEKFGSANDSLLEPRAAAVELIREFERISAALSPMDRSTREDLVQEMCLAALECKAPSARSYYLWLATWRAKDYLRWWLSPIKRGNSN